MPGRFKEQTSKKQIAHTVKRGLILLIACLIVLLLALILNAGRDLWSMWMVVQRKQIIGVLLLAVVLLILLSPILVEATGNTRTLSGPGRNPHGHRLDEWHDELKR